MSKAEERRAEIGRIIAILHRWGIHTLGQFAALPQDQLAARLGPEAVRLWEQASGRSTRLLRLVKPPEIFAEQMEFDHEIENAEPLLFVLHRFLEHLTQRLSILYLVLQEMTLRLTFSDPPQDGFTVTKKPVYTHRFQIPDPNNSVPLLFRLLQTHLENFRAPNPIVAVALEAEPARPGQQQFHLFETPLRDPNQLHETLNRLTALLGQERVGTPRREDSHRVDAFHLVPFTWERTESGEALPNEPRIGPALRRLRLQEAAVPNNRGITRQGPYLSSGDWWDRARWARMEWDLELEDLGVCRCREERPHQMMMEGIYD
jgi:protein ImuB